MSEKQFYARHYGGGVGVGLTPLDEFARDVLSPGKRYSLVEEYFIRDQPSSGCLAEIGCGGGEALLIWSKRYRFDRVVGVDVALRLDDYADPGHHVKFLAGNLNEKWPFIDGEVDHLVAMMIIEHLFDPFHSFQEIRRCLSKNGAAYVNLPLVTAVKNRTRLLFGKLPETSVRYENWYPRKEWDGNHLHYFSVPAIGDLARSHDLRVTDMQGVGRFHRLKSLLPGFLASEVTFRLQRRI